MSPASRSEESSRPTPTIEDYLMNIFVMERDQGEVVAARLAEILNVSAATVAVTLKRMERDGWITRPGRREGIQLTESGRQAAHSVIRRHMLTEWLLVRMLQVPFEQIHAEAHNLEHAISPALEERLNQLLESPQVCPHGNPFPGCESAVRDWLPLTALAPGESFIFRRLHEFAENHQAVIEYLAANGFLPGARARLLETLPFNQTWTVQTAAMPLVLGYPVARYIFVERVK